MDEFKRIDRLLQNLELAWLRGSMSKAEHGRQYSKLMERKSALQVPELIEAFLKGPSEQANATDKDKLINVGGWMVTQQLIENMPALPKSEMERFFKSLREQAKATERKSPGPITEWPMFAGRNPFIGVDRAASGGPSRYMTEYGVWTNNADALLAANPRRALTGPANVNAAEILWQEHDGVVLCECDNPECAVVLTISHDEYLHASGGGGYRRVTSPDCAYGVLGARLIDREKNWHVWTKLA